jgi:cupin fold WbuC family metalloprotein
MNEQNIAWKKGKNDSYYAYVGNQGINECYVSALIKKGQESTTGRARLCFHESEKSRMNIMLIYHDQRTRVPIHRHYPHGEYIIAHQGLIRLTIYDNNLHQQEQYMIDSSIKCTPIWVPAETWHSLEFKDATLFYEISEGSFNDKSTKIADIT